jgi:diguanylate cyclase (GGDEF)-like protein
MTAAARREHRVQFYDSDTFLVKTAFEFVESAQRAGNAVIVCATREHLGALQAMLAMHGHAMPPQDRDDIVFLETRETLARLLVDGQPQPQRFDELAGDLVRRMSHNGSRPLSVFGDLAGELCAGGHSGAALCLEQLWERLAQRCPLDLLCAYPMSAFAARAQNDAFERVCGAHTHVKPIEHLCDAQKHDEVNRRVALLQQRARALENEFLRRDDAAWLSAAQNERIAALAAARAEFEKLASEDPLTGLFNRRVFNDRLAHAVERATRTGASLALIFIDIDDFKLINDTYGHAAGDHLLKQVAARLSLCARAADTVCRWGGDEFGIITEESDAARASVLMQRIEQALAVPFDIRGKAMAVVASAGLCLYPDEADDMETLIQNADAAMYRAKRNGKAGAGRAQRLTT